MDVGFEAITIFILIFIIIYLIYLFYANQLLKIKSSYDNNDYYVQEKDDAIDAANLIAQIREKTNLIVSHLSKTYPNEERTKYLLKNYNQNAFKEAIDNPGLTSYSINKGEQIVLCLRQKNKNNKDQLVDLNTMMFVVLHELGHLASYSIGHTNEFWNNFKWILEESINIGIYIKQDFDNKPVEYCGMSITSSPLDMNLSSFNFDNNNQNIIIEGFKLNYIL